ncbi:MAG: AarF/ABC1/UbiB kinase family protein [Deltaproteobacteria bacterium]|nr:AarF/ABC1/UbiB kinase family protein [Deltaproteobacteria bacterium]
MTDHPKDSPPTSKLGRLARLAGLGTRGLPLALEGAKRALGVGRDRTEDEERAARERLAADTKKAAEAMLKTLGEMKGLPLKVGQMLSYIDGIAPPGYEERFQATLKKLQDKAPPLSPQAAVQVVTEELGAPPSEIFATWEAEPFAAASIGQVHRATTKGGDLVAVKVQYPGIDKAIKNDLQSIHLLGGMLGPLATKTNAKETLAELSEVFLSELDYGREALMADTFRRMHADDPQIVVPRVHQSLSTARVLTTELLDGVGYTEICERGTDAERREAGLTIWRFMFRSLLKFGYLYADPHPGNYRFLGDGRVGFLDFGCVKRISDENMRGVKRYMRAAMDKDWDEFDRACVEVLGYRRDDPSWQVYRDYTIFLLEPLILEEFQCSPERARQAVTFIATGVKGLVMKEGETLPRIPHVPKMPREFVFMNRLQWGLASVLGGLRTYGRFRELSDPWIRGEVTEVP